MKRTVLIVVSAVVLAGTAISMRLSGKAERLARAEADAPASTKSEDRIAFACKRDGNWDIFATRADGSDLVRLTALASQDRMPIWSPDGRKIAFESQTLGRVDDSSRWELWVMDASGDHQIHLTTGIVAKGSREWAPDGRRIVFESERDGNGEIYTVSVDGGRLTRLTDNTADDRAPTWSPDGTKSLLLHHAMGIAKSM